MQQSPKQPSVLVRTLFIDSEYVLFSLSSVLAYLYVSAYTLLWNIWPHVSFLSAMFLLISCETQANGRTGISKLNLLITWPRREPPVRQYGALPFFFCCCPKLNAPSTTPGD